MYKTLKTFSMLRSELTLSMYSKTDFWLVNFENLLLPQQKLEHKFWVKHDKCLKFWSKIELSLSHIQEFSDASAADNFWKHCDKSRNCPKQAISSFATICSTLYSNYTYIYRAFPCFCQEIFNVICCIFCVCGKGLTEVYSTLEIRRTKLLHEQFLS